MKKTTVKQKVGLFGKKVKTVVKTADTENVAKTRMAQVYLGDTKKPLPVSKTVYKANLKNGVIKVKQKTFGPAEYNSEQKVTRMKKTYFKKK